MEPNNLVPNQPVPPVPTPPPIVPPQPPVSSTRKALAALIGIVVAVLAVGAYQALKKPAVVPNVPDTLPSVATSTNASSTAITPDPTADWLTYKNEQYGFEFKYPADLHVSASQERISNYSDFALADYQSRYGALAYPPDEIDVFVMVHPTSRSVSASDYLAGKTGVTYGRHTVSDLSISDGIKIVKAVFAPGEGSVHEITKFFIATGLGVVELSNGNGPNYQQELAKIDQILSTFKFTN